MNLQLAPKCSYGLGNTKSSVLFALVDNFLLMVDRM